VNWGNWKDIGGIVTSKPSAVLAPDGRLLVFARGQDHALWFTDQLAPGSDSWASLGGVLTSSPAAALAPDGRVLVFARGQDHALWFTDQLAPGSDSWASLGGVLTSSPAAASAPDGRVLVFARGQDHALWFTDQLAPGSDSWASFSLGGVLTSGSPAALRNDYILGVFVRGENNAVWYKWGNAESPRWKLLGNYGFLTKWECQSEGEARRRIVEMSELLGVREFQFYDWFADYSTPVRGMEWSDPYFNQRQVCRSTIEVYIDEIHRRGGRAWAYVQSVGAEETDLENPSRGIYKLTDHLGQWHWHPSRDDPHAFPTYFANAEWAELMVARWAPAIKELGFDGIHWDTLGSIAGDKSAETGGFHAFLRRAKELLATYGLKQTLNFVDLAWWDSQVVADCVEFPYAETWDASSAYRYYDAMKATALSVHWGVFAMYPSTDVPTGWTESQVLLVRWKEAALHRLAYLVVGDGLRRMKGQYWPETIEFTNNELTVLRVSLPPVPL